VLGKRGFDSRQSWTFSSPPFPKGSGVHQPSTQCEPRIISLRINQPELQIHHLLPPVPESRFNWEFRLHITLHIPGVMLRHRDNLFSGLISVDCWQSFDPEKSKFLYSLSWSCALCFDRFTSQVASEAFLSIVVEDARLTDIPITDLGLLVTSSLSLFRTNYYRLPTSPFVSC
jgi:hypothetical protein